MQQIKVPLSRRLNVFKTRLKPYIVQDKYRVVPAFSIGGVDYWYFDNAMEVPTGRLLAASAIYDEMGMGCDDKYLQMHCDAMDKILSNPKKIDLQSIMQLNINMKERKTLLMPDFIYKLASVIFFDKTEPYFSYDFEYNEKKIVRWKAAGGTLDFFLNTPIKTLVPSLNLPERDAQTYLQVVKLIDETHRALLTNILSEKA